MATAEKPLRQSVSLFRLAWPGVFGPSPGPGGPAQAASSWISSKTGLEAGEAEKRRFFDLARRFKESSDPAESERLREELAGMIFGE